MSSSNRTARPQALRADYIPIFALFAVGIALSGGPANLPALAAGVPKSSQPTSTLAVAPANTAEMTAAAAVAAAQHVADIETARARCTVLLKSIAAVSVPHASIAEGDCGALAPIELSSVGKNPEVAIVPPVIVTCDLAVAIHDWVKADVQPLARKHLGQPIARMETMSSYSCRNAYGRKMSKLSEHGKANAIDVRGFVTASGQTAYVLENWGMTSGEIKAASVAAEKEQAVREAAAAASAAATAQRLAAAKAKTQSATAQSGTPKSLTVPNPLAGATTIIDGLPNTGLAFGTGGTKPTLPDLGLSPSKLGGPKKSNIAVAPSAPDIDAAWAKNANAAPTPSPTAGASDATAFFLRAVHDSACQRFATTLGPETNAAHRNHLHIDLAERKTAKRICE